MHFEMITADHHLWESIKTYARQITWDAGINLVKDMESGVFVKSWEGILAAMDGERFCGFCSITEHDCLPVDYSPYIGFVFVDVRDRGQRLSQQLVDRAAVYLKRIGFADVYLVTEHEGLYEKYGFLRIGEGTAPWGELLGIYKRKL